MVIAVELLQIIIERNVAGVDSALTVVHNHINGKPVVVEQLTIHRQCIELLYFAGSLADTPAHQHGELHTRSLTDFHQSVHIQRLYQSHHRHGRCHPQTECIRTTTFLRVNFSFHLF